MEKFVSIESVTTYFLVTALCFIFIYFSHEKINRLINIYDPIVLNIFTTANYIGVIYALCSLGHISKEFMLLYTATFVSICIGIRYGSRVSIRYRQVSPCESIFNVDYFILICLFSLYASCVNGRNSFETWSMNGSPHLNRIAIMMGNMTASYFARAASYPVNVYLFLSIIVSKKRWIRLVASFLILSAISLGVVDGSRAAIFGFVFQASVAYFLYQGKYGKNGKKYGSLFLYLLLLAIVTMVFLTVIKERFEEVPKGILFSIAERLVYSADNVIYYHIYLRENFDPKISNPFLYIFHPLLRLFGQRGVTGGIGQSMAYALFQKKNWRWTDGLLHL